MVVGFFLFICFTVWIWIVWPWSQVKVIGGSWEHMTHGSSIYVVTKSSLRGCDGVLPEVMSVTWLEEALPGTGSDGMHNRYILYYYYRSSTKCSTVVQVPWVPEATPKGVPLGVHMCNQKLCNIGPSGAFSLEVTSSNVTCRASPGTGSWVFSRTSESIIVYQN